MPGRTRTMEEPWDAMSITLPRDIHSHVIAFSGITPQIQRVFGWRFCARIDLIGSLFASLKADDAVAMQGVLSFANLKVNAEPDPGVSWKEMTLAAIGQLPPHEQPEMSWLMRLRMKHDVQRFLEVVMLFAAKRGAIQCLRIILTKCERPGKDTRTIVSKVASLSIESAARRGDVTCMRVLIPYMRDMYTSQWFGHAFKGAVQGGDDACLCELLSLNCCLLGREYMYADAVRNLLRNGNMQMGFRVLSDIRFMDMYSQFPRISSVVMALIVECIIFFRFGEHEHGSIQAYGFAMLQTMVVMLLLQVWTERYSDPFNLDIFVLIACVALDLPPLLISKNRAVVFVLRNVVALHCFVMQCFIFAGHVHGLWDEWW